MCTTLYRTKPFSIVLKRTNGNLYDPVSYSNVQYRTKTDQWKCVRPCIVLNHSESYWNWPMGMCTTLYRTQTFSIVLKPTNGNVYDPVSYLTIQYRTKHLGSYTYAPKGLNYFYVRCSMVLKIPFVRPCMVLNVLVRYWKFEYGTEMFSTIKGRTITTLTVRHNSTRLIGYVICLISVFLRTDNVYIW